MNDEGMMPALLSVLSFGSMDPTTLCFIMEILFFGVSSLSTGSIRAIDNSVSLIFTAGGAGTANCMVIEPVSPGWNCCAKFQINVSPLELDMGGAALIKLRR